MLEYHLGEMRCENGQALRYEVERKAFKYTLAISERIGKSDSYKALPSEMRGPRVMLYFQHAIKEEIFPYVRTACVIDWYKRNKKYIPGAEKEVIAPGAGIFPELKKCWDFEDVNLTLKRRFEIKKYLSGIVKRLLEKRCSKPPLPTKENPKKTIACHYVEGLDRSRRNDLNWYPKSGISPDKVLIYFDACYNTSPRLSKPAPLTLKTIIMGKRPRVIRRDVIREVEDMGFRWVALKKGIVERGVRLNLWQAPPVPKKALIKENDAKEDWTIRVANDLVRRVHYWRSFYEAFNVCINYVPEEGTRDNIAQAIAFDASLKEKGILVGKQRSGFFSFRPFKIACHPKHVFFTWNNGVTDYLTPNYDRIEEVVVAGHPNDVFAKDNVESSGRISADLKRNGAKFIISVFDNMCLPHNPVAKSDLERLYKALLEWLLEDKGIGLVIKSKKSFVIDSLLPSIHPLLEKAQKTARCKRIEDELGRLPSEVSLGADMAVGIGIASSVAEVAIAGRRGVHYDSTRFSEHEYYRWGKGKLVFDDLDALMGALKRYKENPDSEPGLGNWSSYKEKLDPYSDGRGGERMGMFMSLLLKEFDSGKTRNEAVGSAAHFYRIKWGKDKTVDMQSKKEEERLYAEKAA